MQNLERWAEEARTYFGAEAIEELMELTGLQWSEQELIELLGRGTDAFYHLSYQSKPQGGVRLLASPWGPLRKLLKRLKNYFAKQELTEAWLDPLSVEVGPGEISHSQAGRSWLTNALAHRHSCFEWQADLADAFGQVNAWQVKEILGEYFENGRLAELLAYLLTIWDKLAVLRKRRYYRRPPLHKFVPRHFASRHLPQGAHTSPFLFERACQELDARLFEIAQEQGLVITRYVDDITVTAPGPISSHVIDSLKQAIQASGFRVNPKKERWLEQSSSTPLEVTGICIHPNGRLTLGQRRQRQFRSIIHAACALLEAERKGLVLTEEQERLVVHKAQGMAEVAGLVYQDSDIPAQIRGPIERFEKLWSRHQPACLFCRQRSRAKSA